MNYMIDIIWCDVDLETVGMSKEEFIDVIIKNDLFAVLSERIVEEKSEDKDFVVNSL